jgi:hypothetical protein
MFENGFLGLFKSAKPQDEQSQQPTWNASTMTMEQPASYTGEQHAVRPKPLYITKWPILIYDSPRQNLSK